MGCCCSSGVSRVGSQAREKYNAETLDAGQRLLQLGTSKATVRQVMALYKKADRNKDGHVDVQEFAKVFDIERENPFLPRLVQLFDVSGDGQMSVFEFIVCLSQFSRSKSTQDHVYFAWRLFDTDDSGTMTKDEFVRIVSATYSHGGRAKVNTRDRKGLGLANFGGTGGKAKGVDSIIRAMDDDGDDVISIREFVKIVKKFSHFMAPAFEL